MYWLRTIFLSKKNLFISNTFWFTPMKFLEYEKVALTSYFVVNSFRTEISFKMLWITICSSKNILKHIYNSSTIVQHAFSVSGYSSFWQKFKFTVTFSYITQNVFTGINSKTFQPHSLLPHFSCRYIGFIVLVWDYFYLSAKFLAALLYITHFFANFLLIKVLQSLRVH